MNADTAYSTLGPCEDYEFELAEFVDGALDAAGQERVRRHLEGCARCRAFVHEFAAVHASLGQALPRVRLSPDFDARLQSRIAELQRTPAREAALARAEQEYRGALASLRKGLTWGAALNALATAAVGGGLVTAAGSVAPRVLQALHVESLSPDVLTLGCGALAVLVTAVAARSLARGPSLLPFG